MKKFYFAITVCLIIVLGIIFDNEFLTINLSDNYYLINYSTIAIITGIGLTIFFGVLRVLKK